MNMNTIMVLVMVFRLRKKKWNNKRVLLKINM